MTVYIVHLLLPKELPLTNEGTVENIQKIIGCYGFPACISQHRIYLNNV